VIPGICPALVRLRPLSFCESAGGHVRKLLPSILAPPIPLLADRKLGVVAVRAVDPNKELNGALANPTNGLVGQNSRRHSQACEAKSRIEGRNLNRSLALARSSKQSYKPSNSQTIS
jgi:hypothetical protein